MEDYLGAYTRKKVALAQKKGRSMSSAQTQFQLPVYRSMIETSKKNIFACWVWTQLQWNCMAPSASIDCLGFHNFSVGLDWIVIKYDETKADKAGEKLSTLLRRKCSHS